MFVEFLAGHPLGALPLLSLAIFLLVVLSVAAHLLLDRNAAARDGQRARIPFEGREFRSGERGSETPEVKGHD